MVAYPLLLSTRAVDRCVFNGWPLVDGDVDVMAHVTGQHCQVGLPYCSHAQPHQASSIRAGAGVRMEAAIRPCY